MVASSVSVESVQVPHRGVFVAVVVGALAFEFFVFLVIGLGR